MGWQAWRRFWRVPRGKAAPLTVGITVGGHALASEKSGRLRGLTPTPSRGAEEVRLQSRGAAKGILFSSWKTQGWLAREATSSTSDQKPIFCLKTAPGLGVAEREGRDGQILVEGGEYLAQCGISVANQLLDSHPGMSWKDLSHQSSP